MLASAARLVLPACLAVMPLGARATAPEWLQLRWPEVLGCPDRAAVEVAAERLTAGATPQPVTAAAQIVLEPGGYTLHLAVRDRIGEQRRTLHSPHCASLADATAVILAVAAEPQQAVSAPPAPDHELPPLVSAPPPPRRGPSLGLFAHALAGLGPARRFAPGLTAGLALTWPRVRLDARGAVFFASPLRFPAAPTVGADLRLAAAAVRGCPRLVRAALALRLCAGLELGALLAQGTGLERNERPRGLWAAGLLAPGLSWQPLRWLALDLEVEGLLALTRRQFVARDVSEPLHTVPPVGLRLGGGLTVSFF